MGGCCQVAGGKNECNLEENVGDNNNNPEGVVGVRAGNFSNRNNNNQKSFLDINYNQSSNNYNVQSTRMQTFLNTDVNILDASKENWENIPEEFRPFVTKNSLILTFNASLEEVNMPIWINEGVKVKFSVFGQWNIFENENYFTSSGIQQELESDQTPFNLPIGGLCGYVQGGDVFLIKNNTIIESNISGPLVLFQNNGDFDVSPTGSLIVIIDGAIKYTPEEIEHYLGWNQELLEETNLINFMSNEEKHILYYLNKLRSNPPMFAKLYLSHRKNRSKSDEECYEFLQNLSSIPCLKPCIELYRAAKYHGYDMAQNSMTGHLSSNGRSLKDRLQGLEVDINKIGENCSYGISNPLAIVMELLVDETDTKGHRKNLLDPNFELVGIALEKHPNWGISCVQDFSRNEIPSSNQQ